MTILGVAIGNNFGLLGLGKHLGLRRSAGVFFERHPKAQEVQGGDGPGRPLIDFVSRTRSDSGIHAVGSHAGPDALLRTGHRFVHADQHPAWHHLRRRAEPCAARDLSPGVRLTRRAPHPAAVARLTEWRFRRAVRWVLSWDSPASPACARAWRRGRGTTSWWVTDHRSARPLQDLHAPFGPQAYAAMDDGAGADGASAGDEDSVEIEGADGAEHDEDEEEDETFALQRTESVFNSLSELYASEAKTAPTFPIGLLLALTAYLFLYAGVRSVPRRSPLPIGR